MTSALRLLDLEVLTPSHLNITEKPEEPHETLQENALAKARFYVERSGLPTIAEDSGLFVEALAGELGVKTRRWGAGETASDEEWIEHFLHRMEREEDRRATFLCTMAYIDDAGTEHVFDGAFHGTITRAVEHPPLPGLPVAGCFLPDGFDRVYAALAPEEKIRVSHRGQALQRLMEFLARRSA